MFKDNYKDEQHGGKLIGRGAYGCVFRPNISCEDGDITDSDNKYISKIVTYDDVDGEYNKFKKYNLQKIDPSQKYIIYPIEMCDIPGDISDESIYDCNMVTEMVDDFSKRKTASKDEVKTVLKDSFANIIQVYGGISFDKFRQEKNSNRLKRYDWKDYVLSYLNILKGLLLLNVNKLAHRDIKQPNIVINPDNINESKLVDLGLMAKFVDSIDEEDNNWSEWTDTDYIYFPADIDAYCSAGNGSYSDLKKRIDSQGNNKRKMVEIMNIADSFCNRYIQPSYPWFISKEHTQSMFESYVRFLKDLFILKLFESDTQIGSEIQYKWDVFMIGAFLGEEYNRSRPGDDGGDLDELREEYIELVKNMTNLHPMERINMTDCIKKYMGFLRKYKNDLNLESSVLDKEQADIDHILLNKTS